MQRKKRKLTKKRKNKKSTHRSEPFGYQPDNPITIHYAKYIGEWKKKKVK